VVKHIYTPRAGMSQFGLSGNYGLPQLTRGGTGRVHAFFLGSRSSEYGNKVETTFHIPADLPNSLIVVYNIYPDEQTPDIVTSATYDSVAMTRGAIPEGNDRAVVMWYLTSPNTGISTFSTTQSVSSPPVAVVGFLLTGVHQSSPVADNDALILSSSNTVLTSSGFVEGGLITGAGTSRFGATTYTTDSDEQYPDFLNYLSSAVTQRASVKYTDNSLNWVSSTGADVVVSQTAWRPA